MFQITTTHSQQPSLPDFALLQKQRIGTNNNDYIKISHSLNIGFSTKAK